MDILIGFALGVIVTIICGTVLDAYRRNPPGDNSEESGDYNLGISGSITQEAGERYWAKNVPADVQRSTPGTFLHR